MLFREAVRLFAYRRECYVNQICMQYRRWRDAREFCREVESLAAIYRYSDGTTVTLSTADNLQSSGAFELKRSRLLR